MRHRMARSDVAVRNRCATGMNRDSSLSMPILPHNQRSVDALTPVNGKRTTYTSNAVTGLVLEVMPSGSKSWRVRYRTPGGRRGKTRVFTIGDANVVKLGPAVDKARQIVALVQLEGQDPAAARQSPGNTFEELFCEWLVRHAKVKKKSWRHDEAMYHRHVRDRLGRIIATELKRTDVTAALDDIAKAATPTQANRAQSLISGILSWAVNEGRLETTPAYRIPKRGIERPRERVLSPKEIALFWQILDAEPAEWPLTRALRLALITGQRRSEICEARKDEFDLESPQPAWVIPSTRTKNKIIHRLPLTPLAVAIFGAAMADSQTEFVFPARTGSRSGAIDPDSATRAMSKIIKMLGIPNATVHDLRRTVGTNLARLGVSKDVRARVLNHIDGARSVTDAVYNQHEFWAEKRAALQLWESELRRIVDQTPVSA